jgi:thiol-disulfide isomerase/thioredoxin
MTGHTRVHVIEERMTRRLSRLAAVLATLLVVGACSASGSSPSAAAVEPDPTASMGAASPASEPAETVEPAMSADPSVPSPEATDAPPVLDQPWATTELTDVATGESFRIADLAGKTVILETMAIWCSNCRAQQGDVYAALEDLDPARVAYVLLDVDPNESAPALAEYRDRNGFTGVYAIAGRKVARALADEFGDQVLNPPSTPMILIGSDGRVTLTDFGQKGPKKIVELARAHGA